MDSQQLRMSLVDISCYTFPGGKLAQPLKECRKHYQPFSKDNLVHRRCTRSARTPGEVPRGNTTTSTEDIEQREEGF